MGYLETIEPYYFKSGLDPDAQAFLDATAITDGTITTAINQLVIDLKYANIWTKFKAIYPIVGGTALAHKYNLKDPRDLDEAFRLVFSGTFVHDANGWKGTNAFADTKLIPINSLSLNSTHVSYYSRTNELSNAIDCGAIDLNYTEIICMTYAYFNINRYFDSRLAPIVTNYSGLFHANRIASNLQNVFRNGTKLSENASQSTALPNVSIYFSAWHNVINGALFNSNRQLAFASIGDGFSDAETVSYNTIVQEFQTTLGRAV